MSSHRQIYMHSYIVATEGPMDSISTNKNTRNMHSKIILVKPASIIEMQKQNGLID